MDTIPVRSGKPTPMLLLRGIYTVAGRSEPVVIVGLGPEEQIRFVDQRGHFRHALQERIRLTPEAVTFLFDHADTAA